MTFTASDSSITFLLVQAEFCQSPRSTRSLALLNLTLIADATRLSSPSASYPPPVSLNCRQLGPSPCSSLSHLLAQRAIRDVEPEAPALATNYAPENDSGRADKPGSARRYLRIDLAQRAALEQVSANTTESATKIHSEISSHLIHRPLRPLHGPMDRKGFMSHHGSSVSITRYTFRMIVLTPCIDLF